MSAGTAYKPLSTGINIPVPRVRLQTQGVGIGQHDRVFVGGMDGEAWDALAGRDIRVMLLRYKMGFTPNRASNVSLTNIDNTRGYVHPSNQDQDALELGRNVGGGLHTLRGGGSTPARRSEWIVTGAHKYDAEFKPEQWFLNYQGNAFLTYPVADVALVGASGQGASAQGATYSVSAGAPSAPMWCGKNTKRSTQVQHFSFCFAVRSLVDEREWIYGSRSETVKADIWPKLRLVYNCPAPVQPRGRKVRVQIV